jgi:hypothetical protein
MSTCAMFTAADASAVLGGKVVKTMSHQIGLFTSCAYATPKPYRLILAQGATSASLAKQRQGATAASVFYASRKATPGKVQTISKLGDSAFYIPGLHELWVLRQDVMFNLTGTNGGQLLGKVQLVKGARRILHHL